MRTLTSKEQEAIKALRQLAENWPKSLTLLVTSISGRVYVIDSPSEHEEDLGLRETFATIRIPIDSCA